MPESIVKEEGEAGVIRAKVFAIFPNVVTIYEKTKGLTTSGTWRKNVLERWRIILTEK